jgi:cytoskeleton protein RodZ
MNDKKTELTKENTVTPATSDVPGLKSAEQTAESTVEPTAEHINEPIAEQADASAVAENVEPEPEVVVPPELPGDRLAARRVEMRWTVEEAASKLKLAPRQIAALEANDFASLPGMAIVRGFIRSYAKLLELDPAPLLEMMASEPNPAFDPMVLRRPLPSMGFAGRRYASSMRHRGNAARRMTGLAALVLIFLLVLVFAGRQIGLLTQLPFSNTGSAEAPAVTEDALISEPVSELAAVAPATTVAENTVTSASATSATTVTPALVPNALIDPSRALEIKLREDAWVEISNQNGVKLISRMMRAGTTEKFEVKEPVVLIIGNATGVDVHLRGQSLNLKAVARDNVSKLNIK